LITKTSSQRGQLLQTLYSNKPPSILTEQALTARKLPRQLLFVNSNNATEFRFSSNQGPTELLADLLAGGANPKYCNIEWVRNHYRWVVWKLACIERTNPVSELSGVFLTYDRVLKQLQHRYVREVEAAHRSALRRVLERDSSSSRFMVLCVADIKHSENGSKPDLELTDGWYSVKAVLDPDLIKCVQSGKIAIGAKLRIVNAQLEGGSDAVTPLEPHSCFLRL
jgi:breast cancer 2 susceptibility protein